MPVNTKVKQPNKGGDDETEVSFSELSRTGGILNAHEAVKLAESMSKQNAQPTKTKLKIKKRKAA